MVPQGAVQVCSSSPFHDTALTASGQLSYLGGNWDRDIAFAGYSIPLQVCKPVNLLASSPGLQQPQHTASMGFSEQLFEQQAARVDSPANYMEAKVSLRLALLCKVPCADKLWPGTV